ncbi:hypothetical protein PoB_000940000 [Plakobranchus ocellatus]|uniref:Uncharacterized protein n=1 Tax=Plakobranchus ocellatus TaxID=259542 RepID=A0AAV3YIH3_9GAST|nr:hypothetical protein PoB_000940000 [Plakobranchus ocellatus]
MAPKKTITAQNTSGGYLRSKYVEFEQPDKESQVVSSSDENFWVFCISRLQMRTGVYDHKALTICLCLSRFPTLPLKKEWIMEGAHARPRRGRLNITSPGLLP